MNAETTPQAIEDKLWRTMYPDEARSKDQLIAAEKRLRKLAPRIANLLNDAYAGSSKGAYSEISPIVDELKALGVIENRTASYLMGAPTPGESERFDKLMTEWSERASAFFGLEE